LLQARSNDNLEAAKKAVRIAEASYKQVSNDPGATLSSVHSELAEALYVESQITHNPATIDDAARHACYAIVEVLKTGVLRRGAKPQGQAAAQPGTVYPIEEYQAYKVLEALGKEVKQLPTEYTSCASTP
jgi:hypothetical protein